MVYDIGQGNYEEAITLVVAKSVTLQTDDLRDSRVDHRASKSAGFI